MPGPMAVTQASFADEVLKSDKQVVVDFWAPWCGPCRYVAPEIEKLAMRHPEIKVVKLNVDEAPLIANTYGIMGIPTIGLFSGGTMIRRVVGAMPVEQIEKQLGLEPPASTPSPDAEGGEEASESSEPSGIHR